MAAAGHFHERRDGLLPASRGKLKLTRRCLEVLAEFRNPVFIITKNRLVTRDIDLLSELARHQAAAVWLSITTLDAELRKVMEPRTAPPSARLAAIRELAQAGIPVGVNVAPVIPGLTDHEMPAILQAAADAGAKAAGYTVVRLPYGVAPLFEKWLETHFPDRKEKVLNRLRSLRGGKFNDSQWGKRMHGEGIFADQIGQMFEVARRKAGIQNDGGELSAAAFRRPPAHSFRYSPDVQTPAERSLPRFGRACGNRRHRPTRDFYSVISKRLSVNMVRATGSSACVFRFCAGWHVSFAAFPGQTRPGCCARRCMRSGCWPC